MKKEKLYLTCPECYIENTLINEFGQDAYFLTALGTVFDLSEDNYTGTLNHFLTSDVVSEITIVNDKNCVFIKNTVCKEQNYTTTAERTLRKLYENNSERFSALDTHKQKTLLAELNIYRQAYELSDLDFIYTKMNQKVLHLNGLICDQRNATFERMDLKL